MKITKNTSKIIVSMLIMVFSIVIAMNNSAKALTLDTQKANLEVTGYQGGDEETGFFQKPRTSSIGNNQDISTLYEGYDKEAHWGYSTQHTLNSWKIVNKIGDLNNLNGKIPLDSIYCLDSSLNFPNKDGGVEYENIGELNSVNEIKTKTGNNELTQEKKNMLYYLFDQTYLREESASDNSKIKEISDARKLELVNQVVKKYYNDSSEKAKETQVRSLIKTVTDDDWAVINQWLIYYVLEGIDSFATNNTKFVDTEGAEATTITTKNRLNNMKRIYNTIKEKMEAVKSTYVAKQFTKEEATLLVPYDDAVVSEEGNGFKISNLKINSGDKEELIKSIKFGYYKNDDFVRFVPEATNEMQIIQEGQETTLQALKHNIPFEVKFSNGLPEDADNVRILVGYSKGSASAHVYVPITEKEKWQSMVSIKRIPSDVAIWKFTPPTPVPDEADLALRKSIFGIIKKGEQTVYKPKVNREPKMSTSNFKSKFNPNGQRTTLEYNHPKYPLLLKKGDEIIYKIFVYNEGTAAGSAKKIYDKLPPHLEFVENSGYNQKYGWKKSDAGENIYETTALSAKVLPGIKKSEGGYNVSSNFVGIHLKVKDSAPVGSIQTNIASIGQAEFDGGLTDRDSTPGNVKYPNSDLELENYRGSTTEASLTAINYHFKGQEDDDDFEKIKVQGEPKPFDLALRKFITKITNDSGKNQDHSGRAPMVDVTPLKNGKTTATYTHPKNPVLISGGDRVVYTIRVFNEGQVDGYAQEIKDTIPKHLEFLPEDKINKDYGWTESDGTVKTRYLSKEKSTENMIPAYNGSETLSYKDLKIAFKVKDAFNSKSGIITNVAQISEDYNKDNIPDRDSTPNNHDGNIDENTYNEHREDDDDFDKLRSANFDLALRKFITKITNDSGKNQDESGRAPKVDVTPLNNGKTTAKYTHPKNPLFIIAGDRVEYTIRIFNEAEIDGYANEIKDTIPKFLEFLPKDKTNMDYGWTEKDGTVTTNYLSKNRDAKNIIKAFNNGKTLDFKDVKIAFKVKKSYTFKDGIITNVAQISEDYNVEGIKDRDSKPNNHDGNIDENTYKEHREDDDDFDKLRTANFDLSLRKFISEIVSMDGKRNKDYTKERAPKVDIETLKTTGTAKYIHPKNPITIVPTDKVIYTIRVFNEGEIDGYAEEIKDNIPEWLEFLPEDKINKDYGWKLDGNVIKSKYLSREASKARKDNTELKAYNGGNSLDYKDVKVAFKIKKGYSPENGVITNIAEISEDYNKHNIPDRDSIPNNDKEDEDDIDKEHLSTVKFDLALRKIVSKIIINENGKQRVINTGHKYPDDPEAVAKAELKKKYLKTTKVKWEFLIRVENQGNIPGYVKEITDYIPEGTVFMKEDNPGWYEKGNGIIGTKKLENKLLNPKDTAVVKVYLRWKNAENNMGVKTNIAEISEDENEFGVPDIDSIPGNKKPGEDDIDDAPVALVVETGKAQTYFGVALAGISTSAASVWRTRRKLGL